MSKQELLDILEENPNKWHNVHDIMNKLQVNRSTIYRTIRNLCRDGEVERQRILKERERYIQVVRVKK